MPILPGHTDAYEELTEICRRYGATLLAVSKTRPEKEILGLYKKGQRIFGENRAHELIIKYSLLPADIEWHLIGHLQTNKVKPLIQFTNMIQSLDSLKLWQKIDEEAKAAALKVPCLLQIKIAREEAKYGWTYEELMSVFEKSKSDAFSNVAIHGVMGMASLTDEKDQIRKEFKDLKKYFDTLKENYFRNASEFKILSMGMSGDYKIALEEGSNMIRIGSLLFD